eukprot:CAMPEP_0185756588 /NCGR_PEP_ID=MMETSP1174-20130828/15012_1 /TAXON_ID=35687 /ORGANISM="Dictyocha speculum, Strain CCMP1381" /LENGTH=334 /DNA_ID=CAMNT_0028435611 /DNA_START=8 /DNA_END=1012 /DNA_ORIENTATION=+
MSVMARIKAMKEKEAAQKKAQEEAPRPKPRKKVSPAIAKLQGLQSNSKEEPQKPKPAPRNTISKLPAQKTPTEKSSAAAVAAPPVPRTTKRWSAPAVNVGVKPPLPVKVDVKPPPAGQTSPSKAPSSKTTTTPPKETSTSPRSPPQDGKVSVGMSLKERMALMNSSAPSTTSGAPPKDGKPKKVNKLDALKKNLGGGGGIPMPGFGPPPGRLAPGIGGGIPMPGFGPPPGMGGGGAARRNTLDSKPAKDLEHKTMERPTSMGKRQHHRKKGRRSFNFDGEETVSAITEDKGAKKESAKEGGEDDKDAAKKETAKQCSGEEKNDAVKVPEGPHIV